MTPIGALDFRQAPPYLVAQKARRYGLAFAIG
jgi:hypothetical protein